MKKIIALAILIIDKFILKEKAIISFSNFPDVSDIRIKYLYLKYRNKNGNWLCTLNSIEKLEHLKVNLS